jgi:acyl carrier protein
VTILESRDFMNYIATELDLDPSRLTPASRLIGDLDLDSVQVLELIVVIEELGVELPDDEIDSIDSIGDAYNLYVNLASK